MWRVCQTRTSFICQTIGQNWKFLRHSNPTQHYASQKVWPIRGSAGSGKYRFHGSGFQKEVGSQHVLLVPNSKLFVQKQRWSPKKVCLLIFSLISIEQKQTNNVSKSWIWKWNGRCDTSLAPDIQFVRLSLKPGRYVPRPSNCFTGDVDMYRIQETSQIFMRGE